MPPKEEEDWENEIQEVTITDWGKMCFGVAPYGKDRAFKYYYIFSRSIV